MNKKLKFYSLSLCAVLAFKFFASPVSVLAADSVALGAEIVPADTLLYAAWNGDLAAVRAALSSGTNPDHVYRHSPRTALMAAAYRGHVDVVNALIAAHADVDLKKIGDGSPLIMAVRGGSTDTVKALLDADADPNLKSLGDEGPAYHAAASGNIALAELLFDAGADFNRAYRGDGTPLIVAIKHGHPEFVRYLIGKGVDINTHVKGDDTALINAIKSNNPALVSDLISAGADVNLQGDKEDGIRRTPWNQAQRLGNSLIIVELEQAGARPQ